MNVTRLRLRDCLLIGITNCRRQLICYFTKSLIFLIESKINLRIIFILKGSSIQMYIDDRDVTLQKGPPNGYRLCCKFYLAMAPHSITLGPPFLSSHSDVFLNLE